MILHTGQQPLNMYRTLYYMDSYYKIKKKKVLVIGERRIHYHCIATNWSGLAKTQPKWSISKVGQARIKLYEDEVPIQLHDRFPLFYNHNITLPKVSGYIIGTYQGQLIMDQGRNNFKYASNMLKYYIY